MNSRKLLKYYSKLKHTSKYDSKYDYYLRKIQYYLEGGVDKEYCVLAKLGTGKDIKIFDAKLNNPCEQFTKNPNPWCNITDINNKLNSQIYDVINSIITQISEFPHPINIIENIILGFCKVSKKCKFIFCKNQQAPSNKENLNTIDNIDTKILNSFNFFINETNIVQCEKMDFNILIGHLKLSGVDKGIIYNI